MVRIRHGIGGSGTRRPRGGELVVEAFEELGGAPKSLKAAVIRAAFGVDVDERAELCRSYRELARHYGARIDPTPPVSPQMKGRVESAVRYIKRNFLPTLGPGEHTVDEVTAALPRWVDRTANQRIHGTTGQRPAEAFEVERAALVPLPATRYRPTIWKKARVHRDSHVVFERRLYSVPWRLIGKEVWLRVDPESVTIFCDDARVAAHARRGPGPRSTLPDHLPAERAALGQRSRGFWEERAAAIGPEVRDFVVAVFERDDVLSMLRPVQAIVTHLEGFPRERAIVDGLSKAEIEAVEDAAEAQLLEDRGEVISDGAHGSPGAGGGGGRAR